MKTLKGRECSHVTEARALSFNSRSRVAHAICATWQPDRPRSQPPLADQLSALLLTQVGAVMLYTLEQPLNTSDPAAIAPHASQTQRQARSKR